MKKRLTVLTLILSLLMVFVLGSCAKADIKTTVHVKFIVGKQDPYLGMNKDIVLKTSADNENGPSVIDLIYKLIDDEDFTIEVDESGDRISLKRFGAYYATKYEGVNYFWSFTINGEEPVGSANKNFLKDGDKVEYVFYSTRPDPENPDKAITEPYDNSEHDIFTDELANKDENSGTAE